MSAVKDIAQKTGVSASTVSLVLNNKPGISEATRKRVLQVAKELGYKNSYNAKSKGKAKAGSLQFVLYKKHGRVISDTPFFSNVLEGVEAEVKRFGFNLLITYIEAGANALEQLQSLFNSGCAGIILLATEMNEKDLIPFTSSGIPLVVLDSYFEEITADTVVINNVQGAFTAVQHLCENGHKEVGYLKSNVPINNFLERKEGYKKALKANKVSYSNELVFSVGASVETAYADMKKHLENNRPLPTAFFADNDVIAIGAIRALKEAGIKIPENVSFVGFDDVPMCEMLEPQLTTIRVPKYAIGQLAVRRLVEVLQFESSECVKIEVRTELVERSSVLKAESL